MMLSKKFSALGAKFSKSEERGLTLIDMDYKKVLSLGISTCGFAEIRMAQSSKKIRVIATTIDREGLIFTKKLIKEFGLQNQVAAKLEDLKEEMPYKKNEFDFIYARLVLHYLDNENLDIALEEMKRVLKKKGRCFVVVKSEKNRIGKEFSYDPVSKLTTFDSHYGKYSRYLHTRKSIANHLEKAGFKILSIKEYKEYLYSGYMREKISKRASDLIEVVCQKI